MILWICVFSGILIWKGCNICNKKTLALYAGVGGIGILILCLYAAGVLPRLTEVLMGY